MENREIHDAYERVRPDGAAKKRMLAHILASAEVERAAARTRPNIRLKRLLIAAAILAVGLCLAAFGYMADFFRLKDANMGQEELAIPEVNESGGSITYDTVIRDTVSFQGFSGSPEFQACAEWRAYLARYDPDGEILAAIGNDPTGIPEDYDAYTCYTRDMADKVDQICQKYGLITLGPAEVGLEIQDLFARCGVGDLLRPGANRTYSGYCYREGTFLFEGEGVVLRADGTGCFMDYQFSRAMKGSFSTVALSVENLDSFQQWSYTTSNGVPLLLANNGQSKALVIADREGSFVVINVLGAWPDGGFDVTNEDLEQFAELFDFSAIP